MIIGHIENFSKERSAYAAAIATGLDYLNNTDFMAIANGRYDVRDGIFALVQEYVTEPKAQRRPESHRDYLDIQYIVKGEEIMGYSYLNEACEVAENLLPEQDLIFYNKVGDEVDLILSAGMFAVFFPWDVHRPSVSKQRNTAVKKVVLKIPVSTVVV